MATRLSKNRSVYFSQMEIDVLLQAYSDYETVLQRRSNKAAATNERRLAWGKIAARVNACNHAGTKRTWQQLKMKHKNLIQSANRKRAEAIESGGGPVPPPPSLTYAEEMAHSFKTENSSDSSTLPDTSAFSINSDGTISFSESPIKEEPQDVGYEDKDTVSAAGSSTENMEEQLDCPLNSALPVKELYKLHLIKKIEKNTKEMCYMDRQIEKTDLEIEILKQKLEEMKKPK